jgi:hypothetical protein
VAPSAFELDLVSHVCESLVVVAVVVAAVAVVVQALYRRTRRLCLYRNAINAYQGKTVPDIGPGGNLFLSLTCTILTLHITIQLTTYNGEED